MKHAPNVWKLKTLLKIINDSQAEIDGNWVPARPLGFYSIRSRMKAAWMVFTGKADALIWPGQ